MIGERFERLVVMSREGGGRVRVRCDCGREKVVIAHNVRTRRTRSCGCLRAEQLRARRLRHGATRTPEYAVWLSIRERCENPKAASYPGYGARGIRVCERWRNSFDAFLADMGARPEGGTIDRIDPNGDYAPDNCRWTDMLTQQNNRRNNILITFRGRTQTLAQWARELGLKYATLRRRIVVAKEPVEIAFRTELHPGVPAK